MNILLTAATEMELPEIASQNPDITTCISGIGAAITMFHLQDALQKNNYDLVIQCGIAGSFNLEKYHLGEVVLVGSDTFADLGISANSAFSSLFDLSFLEKNKFPFTNGELVNETAYQNKYKLALARAATVNMVTDDKIYIKKLQQKFAADIETMEGAALHYICIYKKIPFLQIRAISNEVGERQKDKWKIKEALQNLNSEVNKIIKELA